MGPLHLLHLVLISAWAGVVVAEGVIEMMANDDASRRHAARAHYFIDLFGELPLLLGILATGAWLTIAVWPLTTLHIVKIACGGVAIGANLYCVGVVIVRQKRAQDSDALRRLSKHVRASGFAAPFALVAAYIGLAYFSD